MVGSALPLESSQHVYMYSADIANPVPSPPGCSRRAAGLSPILHARPNGWEVAISSWSPAASRRARTSDIRAMFRLVKLQHVALHLMRSDHGSPHTTLPSSVAASRQCSIRVKCCLRLVLSRRDRHRYYSPLYRCSSPL